MGILDIFKRKKTDGEAERRATLLRAGRITDGSIVATVPVGATDPFRALTPSAGHIYELTNTHLNALTPT